MRVCSPYIVFPVATQLRHSLELGNYQIVASFPASAHSESVVNLFPAVKAQNDVRHLAICKFHYVIIQKHAVCGKCKSKFFIMQSFLLSAVSYYFFYNIKIKQRLTAKEVHLKILTSTGVFYQKVQSGFTDFKAHKRTLAVIFTFTCKAVFAC